MFSFSCFLFFLRGYKSTPPFCVIFLFLFFSEDIKHLSYLFFFILSPFCYLYSYIITFLLFISLYYHLSIFYIITFLSFLFLYYHLSIISISISLYYHLSIISLSISLYYYPLLFLPLNNFT